MRVRGCLPRLEQPLMAGGLFGTCGCEGCRRPGREAARRFDHNRLPPAVRAAVRIAAGSYGYRNPDEYLAYADQSGGRLRDDLARRARQAGYADTAAALIEAGRRV